MAVNPAQSPNESDACLTAFEPKRRAGPLISAAGIHGSGEERIECARVYCAWALM